MSGKQVYVVVHSATGQFALVTANGGVDVVPDVREATHFDSFASAAVQLAAWQAESTAFPACTVRDYFLHDVPAVSHRQPAPSNEEIVAAALAQNLEARKANKVKRDVGDAPPPTVEQREAAAKARASGAYGVGPFVLLLTALALAGHSTPAYAHHRHAHHYAHHHRYARVVEHGSTQWTRPAQWCGWYMRKMLHVADAAYNSALHWLHWGQPSQPVAGAVVVWNHGHGRGHVGIIRSVSSCPRGQALVESGNDGHAVRTRCRSIVSAIGFRTASAGLFR